MLTEDHHLSPSSPKANPPVSPPSSVANYLLQLHLALQWVMQTSHFQLSTLSQPTNLVGPPWEPTGHSSQESRQAVYLHLSVPPNLIPQSQLVTDYFWWPLITLSASILRGLSRSWWNILPSSLLWASSPIPRSSPIPVSALNT